MGGAAGGDQLEAEVVELGGDLGRRRLVGVGDGDEDGALGRQRDAGRRLGLAEGGGEVVGDAHHLASALHLGPEHRVGAGKTGEGQHRLLDADQASGRIAQLLIGELLTQHQTCGQLGQGHAGRLGDERHCARGARVGLDHVELAGGDGVLDVD